MAAESVQIEVPRKSGAVATVEAFPTDCPALVVHQTIPGERPEGWVVTHAWTGIALGSYPHRSQLAAEDIAAHLATAGLDWDFGIENRPRGDAVEPYRLAYQAALDNAARRAGSLKAARRE